jgi:hypothetical protein
MKLKNDFLFTIVAGILTIFFFYPILGTYLFSPNSHMYAFGGDALTIYYNVQYHVCHGSGDILRGMNYPYGELIFLTDAQGALAMILQWINNFIDICDYVIGIINFLNAFSVLIASGIIYTILRTQGVSVFISLLFSPLITLLSPQIFRLAGHFGLAYLFLIPLVYLYIIWSEEKIKVTKFDMIIFSACLFFTFNNPYMGFIGCSLLMISGLFRWAINRSEWGRLKSFVLGLMPLMIAYTYFKINDPVNDRIKIQWGYFSYPSTPKGLLAPKGTLMDDIIKKIGKGYDIDQESYNYIGLVSIIILISTAIFYLYKNFNSYYIKISKTFIPINISSVLLFLYGTGLFFLPFDQDYVEDSLGFLLMFKAVARLGWPLYFTITTMVVMVINEFYVKTHKVISLPIIILLALIWNWDINTYVKLFYKDKIHGNTFSKNDDKYILEIFKENKINPNDFQCILSLPKLMMWTDNFKSELNWSAQFYSQKISKITGLPILNAMLSRMSIGQTAEKIELLANPLIYKSIAEKLPNQKDILIVLGVDYPPLSSGEKFLLEISDTLYSEKNGFSLHRLKVKDINNNKYLNAAKLLGCPAENNTNGCIYLGFNDSKADFSYFGNGAMKYEKGQHTILETKLENPEADHHIFSVWTRFDHSKYGIGWINCQVKDSIGNIIYNETPDTRRSNDVHDSWIRTEQRIPTPKNCTIRVTFDTNRKLYIDELLIRPENKDVTLCDGDKVLLINGFRVERKYPY